MNYLHKKGNNKHNQGGNMINFISRIFVLCLLFSFTSAINAQDPVNKGSKQEIKKENNKVKKGDKSAGISSREADDTRAGSNKSGSKKGIKSGGKTNSAREAGFTSPGSKSNKKAKKGLLGRLFSRSSKSKSSKAASPGSANRPAGGGEKSGGEKPQDTETDHRDKP